ncbi:GGDEF domain-containing protein (plasmid) [Mesorhizobium sp. AaZ16]|uniref:GGDEF domain-containing protein n=1 Tax=Mesorhizobium sp. AaZ16 TaxID=3402289 RepID=UPI00374E768B
MVLRKLSELARRNWVRASLLTAAGTIGCLAFSLFLQALLFSGEDADAFRRTMVFALVLPLAIGTPLLVLLGYKSNQLSVLKQQYIQELAHDRLTSCLNGPLFSAMVDAHPVLTGSRSGRRTGSLLVIDVDHLNRLNDQNGHRAGDQALSVIAGIIRSSLRSGDFVGRIGGDEFGAFLPGATREDAGKVAERIRHAIAEVQFEAGGSTWPLSVSVGVVLFESEIDFDELLRVADQQMQVAKKGGRNRIEYIQLRQGPSQSRPALH